MTDKRRFMSMSKCGRSGPSRGTSAVEMAVVAPVLVAILLGMIECARVGQATQLLTTAARAGCRVAVLPGATETGVQAQVNSVLSGSGISAASVTPTPSNWQTLTSGSAVTVTISIPYKNISWIQSPFFSGATITATATLASENP